MSKPVLARDASIARALVVLRKNGAKHVSLFGSLARGEGRKGSDIDVLVDFSGKKSLLDLVRIEREASEAAGVPVDLLTRRSLSRHIAGRVESEALALC